MWQSPEPVSHLQRHEFEAQAKLHHRGQKLRSASRWDQFIGMSMSQLSGRQSLRDIESSLRSQQHKLCNGLMTPDTLMRDYKRQTLRCRNGTET